MSLQTSSKKCEVSWNYHSMATYLVIVSQLYVPHRVCGFILTYVNRLYFNAMLIACVLLYVQYYNKGGFMFIVDLFCVYLFVLLCYVCIHNYTLR